MESPQKSLLEEKHTLSNLRGGLVERGREASRNVGALVGLKGSHTQTEIHFLCHISGLHDVVEEGSLSDHSGMK